MEWVPTTFSVDTKGTCLLCLQTQDDCLQRGELEMFERISLKFLSRFLNMNLRKIFNISKLNSVQIEATPQLRDVLAPLCHRCLGVMEEFRELYCQYDSIQLRLHQCVQKMEVIMERANEGELLEQFHRRMTESESTTDLISEQVTNNLRGETLIKCKSLPTFPTISLKKVQRVHTSTSLLPEDRVGDTVCDREDATMLDFEPPSSPQENTGNDINSSYLHSAKSTVAGSSGIKSTSSVPMHKQPHIGNVSSGQFTSRNTAFGGREVRFRRLGNNSLQCQMCQKIIPRGSLIHHRKSHSTPTFAFRCKVCDTKLPDRGRGFRHVIACHRNVYFLPLKPPLKSQLAFRTELLETLNEKIIGPVEKKYSCGICGLVCVERMQMLVHISKRHLPYIASKFQVDFNVSEGGDQDHASIPDVKLDPLYEKICLPGTVRETQDAVDYADQLSSPSSELEKDRGSATERDEGTVTPLEYFVPTTKEERVQVLETRPVQIVLLPGTSGKSTSPQPGTSASQTGKVNKTHLSSSSLDNTSLQHKNFAKRPAKQITTPVATILNTGPQKPSVSKTKAVVNKQFICLHCGKVFAFQNSYRVHLFTSHRLQVFTKYLSEIPNLTEKKLNEALPQVVPTLTSTLIDRTLRCVVCSKAYSPTQRNELENHVLVTHINIVLKKLKDLPCLFRNLEESESEPLVLVTDQSEQMELSVRKEEDGGKTEPMILDVW